MSTKANFSKIDILKYQFELLSDSEKVAFIAEINSEQIAVKKVGRKKQVRENFNKNQQNAFYKSLVKENNNKFSSC